MTKTLATPSYSLTPLGQRKAKLLVFVLETLDTRDSHPAVPDEHPSDPSDPDSS
jgi:hypothetical protein